MLKITKLPRKEDVYDITVKDNHNFFANGILVSNCVEITHPTIPLTDYNDPNGEIGVCILSALNMLEIKSEAELQKVCDVVVRMLDELIDVQEYFNIGAKNFASKWRSIAIGVTNYAGWLAKNNLSYHLPKIFESTDEFMEQMQYYCILASTDLAEEKGKCEHFNKTKYSKGILPIDTYKKEVDKIVSRPFSKDWEGLRKRVLEVGMRNSTLTAQMPCESSSVIQCSTNAIDPVRSLITYKGSKSNILPVMVPNVKNWANRYDLAFDFPDNQNFLKVVAVFQKYMDMSISANTWYNYAHFDGNLLPDSHVIKDILTAYKYGVKSLYYCYSDDGNKQSAGDSGCASGACAL